MIGHLNDLLGDDDDDLSLIDKLPENVAALFQSLPNAIQEQLLLDRDSHGNVNVSAIETEHLIASMVEKRIREIGGKVAQFYEHQLHFFGYEGRSALPSPFDATYCYALGQTAALLLAGKHNGYIASVSDVHKEEWQVGGLPIAPLLRLERRKGKMKPVIAKALVELDGAPFKAFEACRKTWSTADAYRY